MRVGIVLALFVAPWLLQCGGSPTSGNGDAGEANDAGDAASLDDAAVDAGNAVDAGDYPAFAPDMPRVVDNGGAILSAPKIVTVTWNADPNQAAFEAFDDAIGGSAYWSATTGEYGVGAATGSHVRIATTPQGTMTDNALDTFVADGVGGAPGTGWPVDDAQTLYIVYVPEATELTSNGASACNVEDGYHDETSTNTLAHIVYAVVVERCHDTQDVLSFSTEVASHEIVETATDPHAETDLAWTGFDADHYAWEVWNAKQDELADACEYFAEAYEESPAPFDYFVQRSWSNANAAAGHDPCVPLPSGAYFNATPLGLDAVSLTVGGKALATKGYSIPVGTKRTIQIGLYSDAPHAPWSVDVVEGDGFTTPSSPRLTIAPAATSGQNGDVIDVDITANTSKASGVLVTVLSSASGEPTHYMPLLVATP